MIYRHKLLIQGGSELTPRQDECFSLLSFLFRIDVQAIPSDYALSDAVTKAACDVQ